MIKKIFSLILIGILIPTLAFGGVDVVTDDSILLGEDVIGDALNGAPAISIAMWYISDEVLTTSERQELFYEAIASSSAGIVMHISDSGGTDRLTIGGRSVSGESFHERVVNFSDAGNPTFFVGILDFTNDEIRLAINGGTFGVTSVTFDNTTYTDGNATIQASIAAGDTTRFFDGKVLHLAMWNTALTQAESDLIFNAKMKSIFSQIQPDNLVFDWWLDDVPDGTSISGKTFVNRANSGTGDGTGDNDGVGFAETVLSYQP